MASGFEQLVSGGSDAARLHYFGLLVRLVWGGYLLLLITTTSTNLTTRPAAIRGVTGTQVSGAHIQLAGFASLCAPSSPLQDPPV